MTDTIGERSGSEERPMSTADFAASGAQNRSQSPEGSASSSPEQATPLLSEAEAGELRNRWDAIQAGFVDEPRRAVEDADALVASAMQRLAEMFASERSQLEQQWGRGDDVSTEDLRVALQRYRAFFGRLLAI